MPVKSRRVLIVEDEESICELFHETLSRRNHEVEAAENGRLGFRKATTFDYDVILFDIHMPEWNGIDSIKGIQLVKPNSRFLVVSAYADRKIADELRAIPEVIGVLLKPADINDIISYVEQS